MRNDGPVPAASDAEATWTPSRRGTDRSRTALVIVLVCALTAGLVAFSLSMPDLRQPVFEEDRIVEWATVAAYAMAGTIGLRAFLRGPRDDLVLLVVVLFCALAILDELSFGERIFLFDAPRILGAKLDSVHDLLLIFKTMIRRATDRYYLVAGAILSGVLALLWLTLGILLRRGWRIGAAGRLVLPGLAFLALLAAQLIDVDIDRFRPDILKPLYVEEMLELAAGLFLSGFAWITATARPADRAVQLRRLGGSA